MTDPTDPSWSVNGAGRDVSYDFGFGADQCAGRRRPGRSLEPGGPICSRLPPVSCSTAHDHSRTPTRPDRRSFHMPMTLPDGTDISQIRLEHVEVTLDLSTTSPATCRSSSPHRMARSRFSRSRTATDIGELDNFTFTTVRHWDEGFPATGLSQIRDLVCGPAETAGMLNSCQRQLSTARKGRPPIPKAIPTPRVRFRAWSSLTPIGNGVQGPMKTASRAGWCSSTPTATIASIRGELNTTTAAGGFYLFTNVEPG